MRHIPEGQQPGVGQPRVRGPWRGWPWLASLVGLGWSLVIAGEPPVAAAATIVVTTTEDAVNSAGDCALREAILAANQDTAVDGCAAGSGADVVVFAPGVVPGTFTLTRGGVNFPDNDILDDDIALIGDLDLTEDVTIIGAGMGVTVINGGADAGVRARIFDIAPGVQVEIIGVTITRGHPSPHNGSSTELGGGIRNRGTLTLRECHITGNEAFLEGGGIANTGTLTLIACSVTDNRSSFIAGGIANGSQPTPHPSEPPAPSTTTLISSTVSENWVGFCGGGIWLHYGTVTVIDSTISNNAANSGGGLSNGGCFDLPVPTPGTLWIHGSTISTNGGDWAGGLDNQGTLHMDNSTVDRNFAWFEGGGMINAGTATATNSTISNNRTIGDGDGGGISNSGVLTVVSSTVSHNHGASSFSSLQSVGGISNTQAATVTLHNTILAQNTAGTFSGNFAPDCFGPILSLGHNLIGDPKDCGINLQATDHTGDPRLGPFTTLGTPGTGHFPLLADSPAVDAGAPAACPAQDQLDQPRTDGDGDGQVQCDIGAIEFVAPQNVNALVQFTPLPATFRTTTDPTGCPAGFVGRFQFQARLTPQDAEGPPLTDLQVLVRALTQGNLLRNAESGPGGVGAILRVPRLQGYADGALRGQDVVDVPFEICLRTRAPFTFLVDVLGVAVPTPALPLAAAHTP